MSEQQSEQQLAEAFVEMADTLVDDFDLIDFLHVLTVRCVRLLNVSAAGLLLTDQRGALQLVAASTEQTRLLELFQLQTDQGPCVECFRTGKPVEVVDLAAATDRWPRFVEAAHRTGFAAVHALPMRLRTDVIGALNLFSTQARPLGPDTVRLGQALADVATIGLLQARAIRQRRPRASSPNAATSTWISRSLCCAVEPVPATAACPTSLAPSWTDPRPSELPHLPAARRRQDRTWS